MRIFIIFIFGLQLWGCYGHQSSQVTDANQMIRDTIKRPLNVSEEASLINLGFVDIPAYQWVEYLGNLELKGEKYSHIFGFQYLDEKGVSLDTFYYEYMGCRESALEDLKGYNVTHFLGNGTIKLTIGEMEYILFRVLEMHDFDRVFKGIHFFDIPTVDTHAEYGLVSSYEIEFSLHELAKGRYEATFLDSKGMRKILYQINGACSGGPQKVSYLDRQDGRIYLINRDCYLELVNSKDFSKI